MSHNKRARNSMYMVGTCSSGAALLRLYPASASNNGYAPVCTKLLLLLTVPTDIEHSTLLHIAREHSSVDASLSLQLTILRACKISFRSPGLSNTSGLGSGELCDTCAVHCSMIFVGDLKNARSTGKHARQEICQRSPNTGMAAIKIGREFFAVWVQSKHLCQITHTPARALQRIVSQGRSPMSLQREWVPAAETAPHVVSEQYIYCLLAAACCSKSLKHLA